MVTPTNRIFLMSIHARNDAVWPHAKCSCLDVKPWEPNWKWSRNLHKPVTLTTNWKKAWSFRVEPWSFMIFCSRYCEGPMIFSPMQHVHHSAIFIRPDGIAFGNCQWNLLAATAPCLSNPWSNLDVKQHCVVNHIKKVYVDLGPRTYGPMIHVPVNGLVALGHSLLLVIFTSLWPPCVQATRAFNYPAESSWNCILRCQARRNNPVSMCSIVEAFIQVTSGHFITLELVWSVS